MAKFKAGQSGNPQGRPKDKTPATLLRKAIADDMPAVLAVIVQHAKDGDMAAAKLLLDRICPALKPQAQTVKLNTDSETLAGHGASIIDATLNGSLPADIAAQFMTALASQAKIIETTELLSRIEALENVSINK